MARLPDIRFFEFFIGLAANNHKGWFDEHRHEYEEQVKVPFEKLVRELLDAMAKEDRRLAAVRPSDCIFRINRDIRFSKDKTPYKLNRSAIIGAGGRKDMSPDGFYVELGPENCGFYAGSYMPEKPHLQAIRQKISLEPDRWLAITADKAFVKQFGKVQGEKQTRVAPEWKALAEKVPDLKNTQFYIHHSFSADDYLEMKDPVGYLMKLWKVAGPFVRFLSEAKPEAESN